MSLSRIEELLEMINNKSGPTDMIPLSRTEEILKCYINGVSYTGPITSRFEELLYNTLYKQPSDEQPLSRSEEILKSKIDKTTYEGAILSRVEELLLELKTEPDPVEITIGPDTILHVLNAIEAAAVSLKIDLTPAQDGTPWISDTLNTEPYLSRAAQNGNKADETIVGGTMAWNQLASLDTSDWTSTNVAVNVNDTTFSITPTSSSSTAKNVAFPLTSGHRYYTRGGARRASSSVTNSAYICVLESNNSVAYTIVADYSDSPYSDDFVKRERIFVAGTNQRFALRTVNGAPTTGTTLYQDVQLIDLTLRFGSTIADYIYSLEEATAGAGVAWLRSHGFIDDVYHAYNPGTLVSAKPTAKVVGATTYTLGGADLRGLFKLDEDNNLYCDGDEYTSDGTITRKYKVVEMGEMPFGTGSDNTYYSTIPDMNDDTTNLFCIMCSKYPTGLRANQQDKTIAKGTTSAAAQRIFVRDTAYSDVNDFKNSLSGVYLIYELATPTTEASTAYTNPQKAGEAESFVDSRSEKVPVGHSTRYSTEYDINGFEGVTVHVSETQTGGTTYPVTFTSQGTVYGGTVDVVSGEMTITWAIADMGDLEWTQPSTGYFEAYFNAYNTGHEIFGLLTTSYPKDNGTNMIYYARITARGTNQRGIVVGDIRYNDVTAFKTAVTGQKVAYELSTPIIATIDPTTINISEGESYVWAEEGDSTLTYMGIPVTRKRSK